MRKIGMPFGTGRPFSFWIVLAVAAHLAVFAALVAYQQWTAVRPFRPRVVSVSLLSLPGGGEPAGGGSRAVSEPAPAPKPEKKAASAPEKKAVKVPEAPKAKKTVPEPKKTPAAKKKPVAPEKAPDISKAIADLKKKVEADEAAKKAAGRDNLERALSRLKESVAAGSGVSSGPAGAPGKGTGAGTGGGGGTGDPYRAGIAQIINANWNFSSPMLQSAGGMEVYVKIQVLRDGTIQQIVFEKRSPSAYLNNSVEIALEKSSPLPPFPSGYASQSEWIGFVFTPEGIAP
ncbi:TonB C-terminal domain-containing protein [Chlorobium sp. N1]|uniref:energy transducer TonB n=1 Tax=Chlorobium sp. N1 TaxID=2491138 RepID=UPI00103E7748|nr:TonB C-terminal domain-containing protein [Chlorobium sp. N1]TCD47047.1 cell envelope integrity protein TolA [Chlorobium sp. N1]